MKVGKKGFWWIPADLWSQVVLHGGTLDLAPCFCDACPTFPKIYEGMGPLMTAIQLMASGGTPSAEDMDSLLTALCPMSSVLDCLGSSSACSSALASMGSLGSSLESLATMKSQCATAGKATSYATSYTFTSPTCSAQESSDADGLLQLNLLAGSFSLFSILNWMWWQISGELLSNDMQAERTLFVPCPFPSAARSFVTTDCAAGKPHAGPTPFEALIRLRQHFNGFISLLLENMCSATTSCCPLVGGPSFAT